MGKLKKTILNTAAKIYFALSHSPLRQEEHLDPEGESAATEGMPALLRRAAAEGAVLLKNDGVLPITKRIALFGRAQADTFYVGYGSGGDVIKPYRVSILDGLEKALPLVTSLSEAYREFSKKFPIERGGWGFWPHSYPEMPVSEELAKTARRETDTAVVVLGRAAGEEMDNLPSRGSYLLSEEEENMLALVIKTFPRVAVVLNIGSPVDLSWLERYKVNAVLVVWQGGMETGNACADLLTGKVSPSGKLTDTFARAYADYPSSAFRGGKKVVYGEDIFVGYRHFETKAREKVLFPFGFGLSYTTFSISARYEEKKVIFSVTNTGNTFGREVVQVYVQKPTGELENPARELVAFHKTKLLAPNETEHHELLLDERAFASFDGTRGGFVKLKGEYRIFCGSDVRSAQEIGAFSSEEVLVQPTKPLTYTVPLPSELPVSDRKISFSDVKEGRASVGEFVSAFSDEELEAISYGAIVMNSPLGADGNAGVMGGVTESLRGRGIPPITMTDGPSGIRLNTSSSLLPCATLLGCTFDPSLVEKIYRAVGQEMKERGSRVLLAPAMNLHRDPLCGRNFEYYSEDPYLTGKLAAAAVRGVQSVGVSACPKHFCCNNREEDRNRSDSRLSERALRELYLRGFEICVKEGKPHFLMTSYNKINGVYAHYNAALVRGILRGEWGFDGCVVTDWWMKKGSCPQSGKRKNNEARVYAGVNVLMPGGGYVIKRYQHGGVKKKLGKKGHLTRAELQKNACEILAGILKTEENS